MAADLQKYLFKSKFLRKSGTVRTLVVVLIVLGYSLVCAEGQECNLECENGHCVDNKCVCNPGWKGPLCQWCEGRVRLGSNSSIITDGSGNYSTDTQCTWLIDAGRTNASIRLHLNHFSTECSWDHLYVFDGDSIYDPLLAVFSGMVVQDGYRVSHIPEVVAHSGSALLYFYSDAAYNLTGFSISYRVDGCPSTVWQHNCSGRGACLDGVCTCDAGWVGAACSIPICPNGCSGHGRCHIEQHKCVCNQGFEGDDCSQVVEKGWWEVVDSGGGSQVAPMSGVSGQGIGRLLQRSSHTLSVVGDTIWILGGHSFTPQPFTFTYHVRDKEWGIVESPSIKKPMSRYGHSAVVHNGSIYMYGGMKENGSITRELWRLDTNTEKWSLMPTNRTPRGTSSASGGARGRSGRRGRPNRRERNRRNNIRTLRSTESDIAKEILSHWRDSYDEEEVVGRRKRNDSEEERREARIRGENANEIRHWRSSSRDKHKSVSKRISHGWEEEEMQRDEGNRNNQFRSKRSSSQKEEEEEMRDEGEERVRIERSSSQDESEIVSSKDWKEEEEEEEEKEEERGGGSGGNPSNGCESSPGPCAPIACVGHAAVIVEKGKKTVMLVIFGHSPRYAYLNTVQEYDIDEGTWLTVKTGGAVVSGVYGHSATWDPVTKLVYVHGGLLSRQATSHVTSTLASYDPIYYKWRLMNPAPIPRFLHSAIISQGLLLIFGGNTHNDTAFSYGAKCYSAEFLAYDLACNTWHTLPRPPDLQVDVARYGHASDVYNSTVYIGGGFNGKMLGSMLAFHPGICVQLMKREECLVAFPGLKCVWNRVLSRCEPNRNNDKKAYDVCPTLGQPHQNLTKLCAEQTSCQSCLANTYDCVWCGNTCTHNKCVEYSKGVASSEGCEDNLRSYCKSLTTCPLCRAHQHCDWVDMSCSPAPNRTSQATPELDGKSGVGIPKEGTPSSAPMDQTDQGSALSGGTRSALTPHRPCDKTCAQRETCAECTEGSCMWCFNQQRCVNNNSYLVSFPYGQCREWTTEGKRCMNMEPGVSRCSIHQTCQQCQADVACGWCDDGSGSGIGVCMEGGQRGAINAVTHALQPRKCPPKNWYFTTCPLCNCNGHSKCENGSQCLMPCANNTVGSQCQYCIDKFFGKPINGGLCKPCQCNEHGDTCNRETGRCNCHTKGVTGDHCERCDTQNNYVGEPLQGSCFYDLQIDYQFTFNLSKIEDRHIRQINFFNVPTKTDVDTDFDIFCSKDTKIKISAKTTGSHESWIIRNFTGKRIKRRFSASEYTFGSADNNTTFHVYVYNFTPPIEIVVSFSQHPKLDLIQFFSIFSLCFLILLTLAAILWKIKQKYDIYTRRQRLLVEMEAMASRPFRTIFLELYPRGSPDSPTPTPPTSPIAPVSTLPGADTPKSAPLSTLQGSNSTPISPPLSTTRSGVITPKSPPVSVSTFSGSPTTPAPLSTLSATTRISSPVSSLSSGITKAPLSLPSMIAPVSTLSATTNPVSTAPANSTPISPPISVTISALSGRPRKLHILGSNGSIPLPGEVKSCNNGISKVMHNGSSTDISTLSAELLHSIATLKAKKKVNPSPIALEPCCGSRAAVLSLLVQLPTGGLAYTPVGHPGGLAVASTLVTLGNPRKGSNDGVTITKSDINKNKAARGKQPHANCIPDTCIRI